MLYKIKTHFPTKSLGTSVHNSLVNYKNSICLLCEFFCGNLATGCFFARLQMSLNRRLKITIYDTTSVEMRELKKMACQVF